MPHPVTARSIYCEAGADAAEEVAFDGACLRQERGNALAQQGDAAGAAGEEDGVDAGGGEAGFGQQAGDGTFDFFDEDLRGQVELAAGEQLLLAGGKPLQ